MTLCAYCRGPLKRKPSDIKKGCRFCSDTCRREGTRQGQHSLETRAKIAASKIGERNPNWKGGSAKPHAGNERARRMYQLGPCEECGKEGRDRHHKDDNPLNNDPGNIKILCRRCHMKEDGRLARFGYEIGTNRHTGRTNDQGTETS